VPPCIVEIVKIRWREGLGRNSAVEGGGEGGGSISESVHLANRVEREWEIGLYIRL
jgi:hypothetical protein